MADLASSIPPSALAALIPAIPSDTLVTLASSVLTSLPVDVMANVTSSLARDPESMKELLEVVMEPELISKFAGILPKSVAFQIVDKLPKVCY
jgi:hypothetical protein